MNNKIAHAVFLRKEFLDDHPHLAEWVRDGNVLDCITVHQDQNYMSIKAAHQKMEDIDIAVSILVPHRYITLVVFDPPKELKLGFHSPTNDNN